jgi:hypothetical protein
MNFTPDDIRDILVHHEDYPWTLQGFGMLRTYLGADQVHRLHIWDARYRVEKVSPIHDHPWDFTSQVIAGELINQRYTSGHRYEGYVDDIYKTVSIRCGEGGCALSPITRSILHRAQPEHYLSGDTYSQVATELHESLPQDGTVTVISRVFGPDRDLARVFWRGTEGWVSAEPRPATTEEVKAIVTNALDLWF